jgi:hypothetical protein
MVAVEQQPDGIEALSNRLLAAALGTADTLSIYLGDRLGWYLGRLGR